MVITYSREQDIGVFVLEGPKDLENAKDAWDRFRRAIVEDNLRGVLIYDNCTTTLSVGEVIEVEGWIRAIKFPPHVKVAIVDGRAPDATDNPFGETVARNRGWPLFTVFTDEAPARRWLGPAPESTDKSR